MEFLRFGSSIPGAYWGCCAVCIIQDFNQDPATKAGIQLVHGDSGTPMMHGNEFAFCGPTLEDVFRERIRIGTFSTDDMPNHVFLAVLTDCQVGSNVGGKWLKILKEEGFEFLRTTDNSVYSGPSLDGVSEDCQGCDCEDPCQRESHPNYVFGLFRNISSARIEDPFTPPQAWTSLDSVIPEAWEMITPEKRAGLAAGQTQAHLKHWESHGPTKIMSESELEATGAQVWYAGQRSDKPPQLKAHRNPKAKTVSAFPVAMEAA